MKKMNQTTVLLTLEYPPQIGGIATYLAYLAERFPAGTFHVLAPELSTAHNFDMAADVPIYRRALISRWLRPRWLPALYWTWWLFRKERPTVLVISHLSNMGRVALIMKRFFRLPYVVILHGMDIALATSGSLRQRVAAKKILYNAAHVVCNSNYTAQWVKCLKIEEKKITIVYPPPSLALDSVVEHDQIKDFRERYKIDSNFLLLSVGRLVERKGFATCLAAVAALREKNREINYVIIGAGPEREKLEQQAKQLGLSAAARFLGVLREAELAVAYAACDVFVMTPRALGGDIEGFGIVYLEAGIFAKPVIGSRSGGVPESVLHEETGLLIEPGNVSELQAVLLRLMDDRSLRERLGQGGQRRLQRDFGDDRQIRRFKAVLRQAASKN
jgi:phosphatidylinositol alpha-1,6-mannosyltransferase